MITYEELNNFQKNVIDDAIGKVEGYKSLELNEVDPKEAVRYKAFRKELEGMEVKRGEISEEELEGYINAHILNRNDDGSLEINAIWEPAHVEKLQENEMVDFDFDNLYVGTNQEGELNKAVYGDEEGYRAKMTHGGSLGFRFEEDVKNEIEGGGKSSKEIEDMIAEFVAEIEGAEDKENYIEDFDINHFLPDNDIISTPKTKLPNGGEHRMSEVSRREKGLGHTLDLIDERIDELGQNVATADGEELDQIDSLLGHAESAYQSLVSEAERRGDKLDQYEDQIDQAYDNFVEILDEYGEIARDIYEGASNANEKVGEIRERFENRDLDFPEVESYSADEEIERRAEEMSQLRD